jgi:SAM-dependent methyltransferase
MAADPRAVLGKVKQYVPISVKRRVRKALPESSRRFWDPDWHRGTVRGTDAFWDYLGKLQLDYLVEQGLKPEHHVLDVGCGPLRAGVHFIGFLEPGHYAGIDKRGDTLERARRRARTSSSTALSSFTSSARRSTTRSRNRCSRICP